MLGDMIRAKTSLFRLCFKRTQLTPKIFSLFCESIQSRSTYLINEKTSIPPSNIKEVLRRGSIIWIDFGFNTGHEFGGMHPALILKYVGDGEDFLCNPS